MIKRGVPYMKVQLLLFLTCFSTISFSSNEFTKSQTSKIFEQTKLLLPLQLIILNYLNCWEYWKSKWLDNYQSNLIFSPDDKAILVGGSHCYEFEYAGAIFSFDISTMQKASKLTLGAEVTELAICPNNGYFAYADPFKVRLNLDGLETHVDLYDYLSKPIAFSPNGKFLIVNKLVYFIRCKKNIEKFRLLKTKYIQAIAFAPDNQHIAIIEKPNQVNLTGSLIIIDLISNTKLKKNIDLSGLLDLCYTSDNKFFITCSDDQTVKICNNQVTQINHIFRLDTIIRKLMVSKDNSHLFGSASNGGIFIWDLTQFKQLYILNVGCNYIKSMAISNDDNYIATLDDKNLLKLWQKQRQELLRS